MRAVRYGRDNYAYVDILEFLRLLFRKLGEFRHGRLN